MEMKEKIYEAAIKAADKTDYDYNGYSTDIQDLRDLFTQGANFALENQWHDLRVNPNDLPDENVDVIVVTKRDVRTLWHRRWNKRIAVWDEYFLDWDEIIAWMPIPEFKQNK
ncbi:MAG: hypothetical protein ACRCZY_00440 [Phocaeicola sp.]